jgi:hypothetical protein
VPDRGCFVLRRGLSTVGPKTFAFELIKEICKCPVARQSCRLVGGEAATLDPNTHRFPSSHYSPAPRRWIDRNAGRKYVVAPMVQSLNHCLRIVVDDANAGTAFADFGRLKGPLAMTFIVRGRRCEETATAVRLRAETAVAKARDLIAAGWQVLIECPNGIRNYPDDFDNLLIDGEDDTASLRQTDCELDVAV